MARLRFLRQMVMNDGGRPVMPSARPDPKLWSDSEITGSCLGHSTVLMNFLGARILTDPVFSTRVGIGAGPLIVGPRRWLRPALRPRDFAAPDLIVLSHAHFDHFDVPSLRKLPRDVPVVTAQNTSDLLRRLRFREIHELGWGESVTLTVRGAPIRISAFQVAHWGARMIRDAHRGYNGYLLERGNHTVCFGGDTAYTRAFAALFDPKRPIDLAIMPIGAYNPWIRAHCNPEQAVAMADQAGARYFVPVHHETFRLGDEPMTEPAARLRTAFTSTPERLLAVRVGETFRVPIDAPRTVDLATIAFNFGAATTAASAQRKPPTSQSQARRKSGPDTRSHGPTFPTQT